MQNLEGDFPATSELTWINVVISLTFVLFDIGVSTVFRLGIGLSLLIAGLRCVGQLALVATVLNEVFETKNPWLVFLICCAFVLPSFSIQADSGSL
jgi:ABC-type iron transport system FetAB permease component